MSSYVVSSKPLLLKAGFLEFTVVVSVTEYGGVYFSCAVIVKDSPEDTVEDVIGAAGTMEPGTIDAVAADNWYNRACSWYNRACSWYNGACCWWNGACS